MQMEHGTMEKHSLRLMFLNMPLEPISSKSTLKMDVEAIKTNQC